MFERIALLGSRELFVLSGAALALGTAYLATLLGLSPALGAFLAGIALSESEVRDEVFHGLVPMRDVFAGLFFVSVGMLVDPAIVVSQPLLTLVAIALIVVVKGRLSAGLTRLFGYPGRTALLTGRGAGAVRGVLVPARQGGRRPRGAGGGPVLAPAGRVRAEHRDRRAASPRCRAARRPAGEAAAGSRGGHGARHARGSRRAVRAWPGRQDRRRRAPRPQRARGDRRRGRAARCRSARGRADGVRGSADNPLVLDRADIEHAQMLVLAIPETFAARGAVRYARRVNPSIVVTARSHGDGARAALVALGVDEVVLGEEELALELLRFTLQRRALAGPVVEATVGEFRLEAGGGSRP